MTRLLGLDFETYGEVDLPKYGLYNYTHSRHFQPLIAVVAEGVLSSVVFDFVEDFDGARTRLFEMIDGAGICAHNAQFEQAVLRRLGHPAPSEMFVDSAVVARIAGAASSLEAAAPQLLGVDKLETGRSLIQLFSIPGKYQDENNSLAFDPRAREDYYPEWKQFIEYCTRDAELSLHLVSRFTHWFSANEKRNAIITMEMNNTGWHVDLPLVQKMQEQYMKNLDATIQDFRVDCDEWELNLSSSKQLQEWCKERGVQMSSFDEQHVISALARVEKRLLVPTLTAAKRLQLQDVAHLLRTKQAMGGSSLKKLQVILNTTGTDGRLHDQYLHIGAGATFRTTGRGVQMQNLPRLNGVGDNVDDLMLEVPSLEWDNHKMSSNIRQVFTASHPQGRLIVGDFSSIESRGLAWQAGEQWKLNAYAAGRGVYEELAVKFFHKKLETITKPERFMGKTGELSCGYQAGGSAVQAFAKSMGHDMTEEEANKLVSDWRKACPNTVNYWDALNSALREVIENETSCTVQGAHHKVVFYIVDAPRSLWEQQQGVRSLKLEMYRDNGSFLMRRVIHGVHPVGNNIHYFKPTSRKTGDLWSDTFTDPKTKRTRPYTLYGGKLAGLLTQSLCREIFFYSLRQFASWAATKPNVQIVGQFHDEIVVDWVPGLVSLEHTRETLERYMSRTTLAGFPLTASVKSAYRYIK